MRKKITAIIPVRKGSQRVKNKNFKEFAGTNLLKIKLKTLIEVKTIDNIVISTDSEEAIRIAKEFGVEHHIREEYYASSKCNNSEFYDRESTVYLFFVEASAKQYLFHPMKL